MRLFLILMALASTLSIPKALADTGCMPIYGGGTTCPTNALTIQKNVVNPATNSDVHDLGIQDVKFNPGQIVTFHITITNTSSTTIQSATVQDNFPQFLTFQNGPGTFNTPSSRLTFQIGPIASGQSMTFSVTGVVMDTAAFPSSDIVCETNQASVEQNGATSVDTSQFCIQPIRNIAAVITPTPLAAPPQIATSPATGPNDILLSLLLPAGLTGFALLRFAKKGHIQ